MNQTISQITELLGNSKATLLAGTKDFSQRKVGAFILGTGLALSMGGFAPNAEAAGRHTSTAPSQHQQQMVNQIPAVIVEVERVRPTDYQREVQYTKSRGSRMMGEALGGLVGTFLGNKSDNRYASSAGQVAGSMVGALSAEKLSEMIQNQQARRQGNVEQVDTRVVVTVDVDMNGERQRYKVDSPDMGFKSGQNVFLTPNNQGGVSIVVPEVRPNMRMR